MPEKESARKVKYFVNGIGFSSIEGVKDQCRLIKNNATLGIEPEWGVSFVLDHNDQAFMMDVINHRPDSQGIIGEGIASIRVGYVPPDIGKPHWGFYAIRTDGSECLFGFSKFGMSAAQIQGDRIGRAKRLAISDQVISYKEQYFDGQEEACCEATGELIARTNCHVDHAGPTFQELDRAFFGDMDVEVMDDGMNWHIANPKLRREWQDYHEAYAVLRCVTIKYNLTRKDSQS